MDCWANDYDYYYKSINLAINIEANLSSWVYFCPYLLQFNSNHIYGIFLLFTLQTCIKVIWLYIWISFFLFVSGFFSHLNRPYTPSWVYYGVIRSVPKFNYK